MDRYDKDRLDEIRDRINLGVLLRDAGIALKPVARGWRGRCPFEEGTNASRFSVTASRYHCFKCGKSGDVFSWFQEWERLGFRDAVTTAARIAGIAFESVVAPPTAEAQVQARQRARRAAALESLDALARTTASGAGETERVFHDIELTPLIVTGEAGLLPDRDAIRERLRADGVSAATLREINLEQALPELAGKWLLWARRNRRPIGARLLGASPPTPTIGLFGARSRGWVSAPAERRRGGSVVIAGDDALYVALRAAGAGAVFRPLTDESLDAAHELPAAGDKRRPPVFALRADGVARRLAFDDVLRLLPTNARLRATELTPLPLELADPGTRAAMLDRALEDAGTAFDWQSHLLLTQGALATSSGRAAAAERLKQMALVVAEPVERLLYELEIEELTGRAVSPGRVEAARGRAPEGERHVGGRT